MKLESLIFEKGFFCLTKSHKNVGKNRARSERQHYHHTFSQWDRFQGTFFSNSRRKAPFFALVIICHFAPILLLISSIRIGFWCKKKEDAFLLYDDLSPDRSWNNAVKMTLNDYTWDYYKAEPLSDEMLCEMAASLSESVSA